MDSADHFRQSIELAVATIRDTDVARYDEPTPCADYAVRDVVNHLAFGFLLAHRSGAREPWDPSWSGDDRTPYLAGLAEEKWAQACADEAAATTTVWAEPATWEGEASMGGAAMPAAAIGSMMTAEFAVHAWDLARATGGDTELDGELVTAALVLAEQLPEDGVPGLFDPPLDVSTAAPPQVRLLARFGRKAT
jgi:uncharacterized protein (TIGR03086 family)